MCRDITEHYNVLENSSAQCGALEAVTKRHPMAARQPCREPRQGLAFGDVFPRFPNAVVLGVSNLRSGHTRINPPAALRLEAGDALARPRPPPRPAANPAARRASSACGLLGHAAPARTGLDMLRLPI